MHAQIFLGIGFTNWNVIGKYFRMNFPTSVSTKNDLVSLLCRVRVGANFPLVSAANNLGCIEDYQINHQCILGRKVDLIKNLEEHQH